MTGQELAEKIPAMYKTIVRIPSLRPALFAFPLIKKVVFLEEEIPNVIAFVLPDGTVVISVPPFLKHVDEYYKVFALTRIPIQSPYISFLLWVLVHEITHIIFRHYERVRSLIKNHGVPLEIAIAAAEMECNAIASQMLPCPPYALMPQAYNFAINASLEEMALQLYERASSCRYDCKVPESLRSCWDSLAKDIERQIGSLPSPGDGKVEPEITRQEQNIDEKRNNQNGEGSYSSDIETEEQESVSSWESRGGQPSDESERKALAGKGDVQEEAGEGTAVISVDPSLIEKVNQSMERFAESLRQWKLNEISPSFFISEESSNQTPSVFSRVPSVITNMARKHLAIISPHYAGWERVGDDIDVPTDPIGNVIRIISQRLVEIHSRRSGVTWTRPSRRLMRWYAENRLYLPGKGHRGLCLGIVVDTSASMWNIVDKAIGLAYGTKGDDIWIVPCDVVGYTPFRAKEKRNRIPGRGGTYLWEGVKTLYDRRRFPFLPERYSALIIISDGFSNLPTEEEVREFWAKLTLRGIPLPDRYFVALVYSQESAPDLSFWTKVGFRGEMVVISAL